MRLRKTTRGGRRRWLARPTWRALALVAIVGGVWLANGWWYIEIAHGATLEVYCGYGLLAVLHDGGGIYDWTLLYEASASEPFRIYRRARFHLDLDCRPRLHTYAGPDYGPWAFKLYLPLIVLVAPLVGAILLWSMWRRQPFPAGRCAYCGYDLRGTTRGRCPECGTTVSRPPHCLETR